METLGFNLDIFWWGGGGIILTIVMYFVAKNLLENISEDEMPVEHKTSALKWVRITAISFWVLWFAGMILFNGIKWTATDTADMGSEATAEIARTYEAPSSDEILEMNRESVNSVMEEREEEREEANKKSSEEYEKFLSESRE